MIDVVTLSEAQAYADTHKVAKPAEVTTYADNAVTLADNTVYTFTEVTTLVITVPSGALDCHMFLTMASEGTIAVSFSGAKGVTGDDITTAAVSEVWEVSFKDGYACVVNWGVPA